MKVLAIVASARKKGNINNICSEILAGAKEAGHQTELINLYDYHIKSCIGCLTCTKTRKCAIEDDFAPLFQKEKEADVVIYGTPIYCYDVAGILKNFMDRHVHAVIPAINLENVHGFLAKAKLVLKYLRDCKKNGPFKRKKFMLVISCSSPIRFEKQMKHVLFVLKAFIQHGMQAHVVKKIICLDTLFRFSEKKFAKIMKLAYQAGATVYS